MTDATPPAFTCDAPLAVRERCASALLARLKAGDGEAAQGTPLDWARHAERPEIVELLRDE